MHKGRRAFDCVTSLFRNKNCRDRFERSMMSLSVTMTRPSAPHAAPISALNINDTMRGVHQYNRCTDGVAGTEPLPVFQHFAADGTGANEEETRGQQCRLYFTAKHRSLTVVSAHRITSHHITSHHITSHHITSHHITSHHITSHHRRRASAAITASKAAPRHQPAVPCSTVGLVGEG